MVGVAKGIFFIIMPPPYKTTPALSVFQSAWKQVDRTSVNFHRADKADSRITDIEQ